MNNRLNVGDKIYDANMYEEGTIIEINDDKVVYRDDDFNVCTTNDECAYKINTELTEKYGIVICDEHNYTEQGYEYFIPIADENAFEYELETYSVNYAS